MVLFRNHSGNVPLHLLTLCWFHARFATSSRRTGNVAFFPKQSKLGNRHKVCLTFVRQNRDKLCIVVTLTFCPGGPNEKDL